MLTSEIRKILLFLYPNDASFIDIIISPDRDLQFFTKISKWIEETISSRTDVEERKLSTILQQLKKGDILIASELSRFGRNLLQVMSILHECMDKNCQVWTIKENYRLGNDIQSKVMAVAFGLSAEIERNLISQRTKASLDNIRATGKKLGRPFAAQSKKTKTVQKHKKS